MRAVVPDGGRVHEDLGLLRRLLGGRLQPRGRGRRGSRGFGPWRPSSSAARCVSPARFTSAPAPSTKPSHAAPSAHETTRTFGCTWSRDREASRVRSDDVVASRDETLAELRTDEAGPAGDDDAHFPLPVPRSYRNRRPGDGRIFRRVRVFRRAAAAGFALALAASTLGARAGDGRSPRDRVRPGPDRADPPRREEPAARRVGVRRRDVRPARGPHHVGREGAPERGRIAPLLRPRRGERCRGARASSSR